VIVKRLDFLFWERSHIREVSYYRSSSEGHTSTDVVHIYFFFLLISSYVPNPNELRYAHTPNPRAGSERRMRRVISIVAVLGWYS